MHQMMLATEWDTSAIATCRVSLAWLLPLQTNKNGPVFVQGDQLAGPPLELSLSMTGEDGRCDARRDGVALVT